MHILARTHSNPLHQTKNKTKLTAAFLIVHINSVLKELKILYVHIFENAISGFSQLYFQGSVVFVYFKAVSWILLICRSLFG